MRMLLLLVVQMVLWSVMYQNREQNDEEGGYLQHRDVDVGID